MNDIITIRDKRYVWKQCLSLECDIDLLPVENSDFLLGFVRSEPRKPIDVYGGVEDDVSVFYKKLASMPEGTPIHEAKAVLEMALRLGLLKETS